MVAHLVATAPGRLSLGLDVTLVDQDVDEMTSPRFRMKSMADLITPEIRGWVSRSEPPLRFEVTRRDIMKYAIATEQRLEKYRRGDEAPPMFLFNAQQPLAPIEELRPDGIAVDPLLPELPLKRVMAGGIRNRYYRPIKPGDVLVLTRTLTDEPLAIPCA